MGINKLQRENTKLQDYIKNENEDRKKSARTLQKPLKRTVRYTLI